MLIHTTVSREGHTTVHTFPDVHCLTFAGAMELVNADRSCVGDINMHLSNDVLVCTMVTTTNTHVFCVV